MKKGVAVLLILLSVSAIGGVIFLYLRSVKKEKLQSMDTEELISGIINNPKSGQTPESAATMIGFEKNYPIAWYDALDAKKASFTYNGKMYNSYGGRAIA